MSASAALDLLPLLSAPAALALLPLLSALLFWPCSARRPPAHAQHAS